MKQSKESKAVGKINQALGGIEVLGAGFELSGNLISDKYAKDAGHRLQEYAQIINRAINSLGLKVF